MCQCAHLLSASCTDVIWQRSTKIYFLPHVPHTHTHCQTGVVMTTKVRQANAQLAAAKVSAQEIWWKLEMFNFFPFTKLESMILGMMRTSHMYEDSKDCFFFIRHSQVPAAAAWLKQIKPTAVSVSSCSTAVMPLGDTGSSTHTIYTRVLPHSGLHRAYATSR